MTGTKHIDMTENVTCLPKSGLQDNYAATLVQAKGSHKENIE